MDQIWPIFLGIMLLVLAITLFKDKQHLYFLKACILFLGMLVFSFLNFVILLFVAFLLIRSDHALELKNLFLLIGILVVISGIMIYWGLRGFNKVFPLSITTLTLIEYCIQWVLIYITIYQTMFSNIKKLTLVAHYIKIGDFLDPNIFVIIVLPSFISIWIGLVLLKKHLHEL